MSRAVRALRQIERAERKVVLNRYARLKPSGKPIVCTPGRNERSRHSEGKVIFDSQESAVLAAAELVRLGARRMTAYPCPRSKRGHWHLATEAMT